MYRTLSVDSSVSLRSISEGRFSGSLPQPRTHQNSGSELRPEPLAWAFAIRMNPKGIGSRADLEQLAELAKNVLKCESRFCRGDEHIYVYNNWMKRRDLETKLRALGWKLLRHGGKHDVWSNVDGSKSDYVPRHNEVNENLAKAILKNAGS